MSDWRVVGASVPGSLHVQHGLGCDDAHGWYVGDRLTLLVIADGAGSKPGTSAIGSHVAVSAALSGGSTGRFVEDYDENPSAATLGLVERAVAAIAAEAESLRVPIDALATTMCVAVLGTAEVRIAQIGDGLAGVENGDGKIEIVARADRFEYANEVIFLTRRDALEHVKVFGAGAHVVKSVALSSDGLRYKMLDDIASVEAFPPFFHDSWDYARAAGANSAAIESFLIDVDDQTGDDLTLVLAVRGYAGKPGIPTRLTERPPRPGESSREAQRAPAIEPPPPAATRAAQEAASRSIPPPRAPGRDQRPLPPWRQEDREEVAGPPVPAGVAESAAADRTLVDLEARASGASRRASMASCPHCGKPNRIGDAHPASCSRCGLAFDRSREVAGALMAEPAHRGGSVLFGQWRTRLLAAGLVVALLVVVAIVGSGGGAGATKHSSNLLTTTGSTQPATTSSPAPGLAARASGSVIRLTSRSTGQISYTLTRTPAEHQAPKQTGTVPGKLSVRAGTTYIICFSQARTKDFASARSCEKVAPNSSALTVVVSRRPKEAAALRSTFSSTSAPATTPTTRAAGATTPTTTTDAAHTGAE